MKYFLLLILLLNNFLYSNSYPNKALTIIVPFGEGGSTDRLARTMKPFLEEEFNQTVNIVNAKGQGTLLGTNKFLNLSSDGYTILCSSFSPYIPNAILSYDAPYSIEDFEIINLQWFDFEFIAVSQYSSYSTILELIKGIKTSEKPFKVAVLHNSTGHLIVESLIKELTIPKNKIEFIFFHGGKSAREALVNQDVDFIVISAQGSEKYRNFIKPIAVIKDKKSNRWDAPTLNEGLKSVGISIPTFKGSMRGFAVSKTFKDNYPNRYKYLVQSLKKVIAKKKVQNALKKNKIGYIWFGSNNSNRIFKDSFELFEKYNYLREN